MSSLCGWTTNLPWSEKWSGHHYNNILWRYQLPLERYSFYQLWSATRKRGFVTVSTETLRFYFKRATATKAHHDLGLSWGSVHDSLFPKFASAGQWMKGRFRVIYCILPSMSWIWYSRKNETAQRSGYDRSTVHLRLTTTEVFWAIDSQLTVSTFDSTYSKFLWVL